MLNKRLAIPAAVSHLRSLLLLLCVVLPACQGNDQSADAQEQQAHIREVVAAGGTIDSILPIAEHVRRFQATTAGNPDTLRHASKSLDDLMAQWAQAVSHADTTALNMMVLDRAEFGWLYFPESHLAQPPYEAPPELIWGQVLASSNAGAKKLLGSYSGQRLKVLATNCPAATVEGNQRLYDHCLLTLEINGKAQAAQRYFGTVVERDGRFKFMGFANRL